LLMDFPLALHAFGRVVLALFEPATATRQVFSMYDIYSARSIATPTCPVCAENMSLSGVSSVTFSGGKSDQVLKYFCANCRVEMNKTVKTSRITHEDKVVTENAL
jgi:hypothetical protein